MDLTLLDFLKIVLQVQMSAVLSSAQNGSKITPLTAIRHLIYILSWYTDSTLVTKFSNLYEDAKWSFSAVFSAQKLYLVHRMNSNFLCSVQNISVTIPYLLFSGLFKINQKKRKKKAGRPAMSSALLVRSDSLSFFKCRLESAKIWTKIHR
jgi:hypothetical protein